MNHDDDLERLISGSLASRSERIGVAGHSLDDVHRRVEMRRGRRRHVAVFGATAMVAAGAFALTAIGSSDPSVSPLVPADAADQPDAQPVWRCTGQLDVSDGSDATFFADCQLTAADGNGAVVSVPVTTIPLYPTTTSVCLAAPATAPPTTDVAVTNVPCEWGPPPTAWNPCSTVSVPPDVTVPCTTEPWPTTTTTTTTTMTTTFEDRVPYEQEYTIQPGDSLASISQLYGITLEQLVNYNEFADGVDHLLIPGERLLLPPNAFVIYGEPGGGLVTTTPSIP